MRLPPLHLELLLLELGLDNFNLGELVELLNVALSVGLGRRELGREEGVDERRFSQSRLACCATLVQSQNHSVAKIILHAPTTITVKCAPRFATILCLC